MGDSIIRTQVDSTVFTWDKEKGVFTFDGAPSMLFWDSAIELFISTIIEISGEDVSNTVLEATGFRMGELVSSYYKDRIDTRNVLTQYIDIYRNAGWGKINVRHFCLEDKRMILQLENSWEHRIYQSLKKEQALVLLPSHWAGVFTGLLKENMWYKVNKSQLSGSEYDEIEIFPSTITPNDNIHELARQKEQAYISELEQKVADRTHELTDLVKHLSTPIMPVLKGILAVSLVGKFNDERFEGLLQTTLFEFSKKRASYLLLDMTAISEFDEYIVFRLHGLVKAVSLLGGECILVGISPTLGVQIVNSGVDLSTIPTFSTLEQGIEHAVDLLGYEIVKKR
ncbi:STAS domain-containing protein [Niallia sp. MER 6]|uniref:STAS domain-containing protein n=1 Tax=Niallia sp. MER 6 TaxID=2939567 RepID=UPI0020408CD4|nr:STAS domain-containing protein [Niallia sp. MER 6]MCM3031206.1 STAS domain-containing protein [Niallia sp. MER 6]